MARRKLSLIRPSIAAPCDADWDEMPGTAEVRHCARCRRDVHDLDAMPRARAVALVRRGGACVRFVEIVAIAALAACEPKPPRAPLMQLDVPDAPLPGPIRDDPTFERAVQRMQRGSFLMGRL